MRFICESQSKTRSATVKSQRIPPRDDDKINVVIFAFIPETVYDQGGTNQDVQVLNGSSRKQKNKKFVLTGADIIRILPAERR